MHKRSCQPLVWIRTLVIALVAFCLPVVAALGADVYVKGYYRKNGTYVQPHYRSGPDGNPYNNYSFPGNVNPYTGEIAKGDPKTYLRDYYGSGSSVDPATGGERPSALDRYFPRGIATDTQRAIAAAQLVLHAQGYKVGTVDGVYGSTTRNALTSFQLEHNLPATGEITRDTADALIASLKETSVEKLALTGAPTIQPAIPENAHVNLYRNDWECDRGFRRFEGGCAAVAIPTNAQLNVYGNGWECSRGFRGSGGGCVAVDVPKHAQLNVYGNGWECTRGFRSLNGGCGVVEVPANAQLNVYGNGWECSRGFRMSNGGCVAVQVPLNAQLNVYGNGWECARGFRRSGDACAAVEIPANGQLNVYGNGWECARGFRSAGDGCAGVQIPSNGQLNVYGNGWECVRGYRRSDDGCERIEIPANAQLNVYGNGWECLSGYRRVDQECI
jgi:hypothetical protein